MQLLKKEEEEDRDILPMLQAAFEMHISSHRKTLSMPKQHHIIISSCHTLIFSPPSSPSRRKQTSLISTNSWKKKILGSEYHKPSQLIVVSSSFRN